MRLLVDLGHRRGVDSRVVGHSPALRRIVPHRTGRHEEVVQRRTRRGEQRLLVVEHGRAARCSRNIRQIEARARRVAPLVCQQTGSDVFGDKSSAHLTRQRQHIPFGFAAVPQRGDLRGRKGVVEKTCAEDDSGERPAAVR